MGNGTATGLLTQEATVPTSEKARLARYLEPRWYAAYTRARHEKRVSEELERKAVQSFLPLYETVHRWRNGPARVELPLFPGYVFVRIPLRERLQVLEVRSVVRLVGFNGEATPLPDEEIETLRERLNRHLHAEPYRYLRAGRRVRVQHGPLAGVEGILIRTKNKFRIVLSIDLVMRSIAVEVDQADVDPLS